MSNPYVIRNMVQINPYRYYDILGEYADCHTAIKELRTFALVYRIVQLSYKKHEGGTVYHELMTYKDGKQSVKDVN